MQIYSIHSIVRSIRNIAFPERIFLRQIKNFNKRYFVLFSYLCCNTISIDEIRYYYCLLQSHVLHNCYYK